MPLDTAQLAALRAVLQYGSFERAAQRLHVTPPAISQRIARLGDRLGLALVERGSPCSATAAGARVVRHAERVALAERDMLDTLGVPNRADDTPSVRVAVNADSLASWCTAALATPIGVHVNLIIDDEERSADWLRSGESPVTSAACLGATAWIWARCVIVPLPCPTISPVVSPTA